MECVKVRKFEMLLFTAIVFGCASGHPSASGWQDNSIPESSGSTGWQSTTGNSGWQGTPSTTEWRPASGSSAGSGWSSGSGSGSGHNFYDSAVSTDYVSRYHGPVALPVVLPDGTIADTPEVAQAKAAHLAALEKAKELWYGPKDDGSYDPHKYEEDSHHGSSDHDSWKQKDSSYHDTSSHSLHTETNGPLNAPYSGPLASPKVLPSGYLEDTPSIEAARAAHLTALWKAKEEAAKWKQGWKNWK